MTALLLSYLWLWVGAFPGDAAVCLLLAIALALASHRRRGESARDLGFRVDNLGPAARTVFAWAAPLLLLMVGVGIALSLHREPPVERLLPRLAWMPLFGMVQEYLLLGFYYRRFEEAIPGRALPLIATVIVFSALHLPNPFLTAATAVIGFGACWLYRRARNLWVLGVAHGLASIVAALFLAELLTGGLKVGLRALP
jgi:membrane protease YdiL (CAAX protease family)